MYQKRIHEEYWQTSSVMKLRDFSTVTQPFQKCNAYKFSVHLFMLTNIDCQLCKAKLTFIKVLC